MEDEDHNYRSRWLDTFLATYAMVGVLAGIAVAVATNIKKDNNATLVGAVCILSGIEVVLILWMFRRLRMVYDHLGFTPTFGDERAQEEFLSCTKHYADRGKAIRKASELVIHFSLGLQALLLWLAWR